MRIRVIQRPTMPSVDGLELNRFQPGNVYEVGPALGCLLLSEGWAEPVASEPPLLAPMAGSSAVLDRQADEPGAPPPGERSASNRDQRSARRSEVDVAADYPRAQMNPAAR